MKRIDDIKKKQFNIEKKFKELQKKKGFLSPFTIFGK